MMAEVRNASVNRQIRAIEHWAASWSAHDMERLLPLFTEDVIYEDVTIGVMRLTLASHEDFGKS
jgi:ketosteroid isomerase-like protein